MSEEEEAAGSTYPYDRWRPRESEVPQVDAANAFFLILTYFRKTNAEALHIRERLVRARAIPPPAGFEEFEEVHSIIRYALDDAATRARAIEALRRIDPGTEAWYARELVEVTNAWDDLRRVWYSTARDETTQAALLRRAEQSIHILDELAFLCACVTIPDELKNYLQNYRIGTRLDFVATFRDQLPDEAYTRRVLETLAPQSELVPGLIDVRNCAVIKADRRTARQVLSVMAVLAATLLGFALIAVAVHLGGWLQFPSDQWPLNPGRWVGLNGGYVLILLGVLGHWILERVKLNRSGADVTPFSEWLMWIHVNEVQIVVRIATVWLLLALGVAFRTFNLSSPIQPLTFFTAGYFIDSTFDALVGRFNTFIGGLDPDRKKS